MPRFLGLIKRRLIKPPFFLYKTPPIFYNCNMLEILSARGVARRYSLKKGVKILSFDGYEAVDELDYLFYDSKPSFSMRVSFPDGGERDIAVEKGEDESLNLTFKKDEKIRTCQNKCVFCFVDQMPENMRDSLYVKDDDYVLSFMCGNFVTLTNLLDFELERIIRLHMSPMYVSVHTTDGELRKKMLGNRFADKIFSQLTALKEGGIEVHCQAVIVPDMNDGEQLEKTARDLFSLYPEVRDLAVVPTGLTKFRESLAAISDVSKEGAEKILDLCDRLNAEFKVNFLLPADEYYIKCGRKFKGADFYGDFSQVENGVGITSKITAEFEDSVRPAKLKKPRRVAVITGVSAYSSIEDMCKRANLAVENLFSFALPVKNDFFGDSVTCTGLLTGGDILKGLLSRVGDFDVAIIPAVCLKEFEDVFLDGMTLKELKKSLKGKKIIVNRNTEDFFGNLIGG